MRDLTLVFGIIVVAASLAAACWRLSRRWRSTLPRRGDGNPQVEEVAAFRQMNLNEVRQRAGAARAKFDAKKPGYRRYGDADYAWRKLEAELREHDLWQVGQLRARRVRIWAERLDTLDPDGLTDSRRR